MVLWSFVEVVGGRTQQATIPRSQGFVLVMVVVVSLVAPVVVRTNLVFLYAARYVLLAVLRRPGDHYDG